MQNKSKRIKLVWVGNTSPESAVGRKSRDPEFVCSPHTTTVVVHAPPPPPPQQRPEQKKEETSGVAAWSELGSTATTTATAVASGNKDGRRRRRHSPETEERERQRGRESPGGREEGAGGVGFRRKWPETTRSKVESRVFATFDCIFEHHRLRFSGSCRRKD
jgi:hypothetical protein